MPEGRIILLARSGESTNLVYNALVQSGLDVQVVLETPPTLLRLLRLRMRTQGVMRVFGQVLFQLIIARPLAHRSRDHRARLITEAGASTKAIPPDQVHQVASVNTDACHALVRASGAAVVVINGTRILTSRTIEALARPTINMHAGITPGYRGVHGGYWALVNDDRAHCGVTVHLVDAGIDTGAILAQATITPGPRDDFSTYPTLQTLAGLPLLVDAVRGRLAPQAADPGTPGRRWYHPTLWCYLRYRWRHGVK